MPRSHLLVILSVAPLALACSKDRDTREWNPQDHAHPENQPAAKSPSAPAEAATASDIYTSTCAPCHGPGGRGDGPTGRSLRVTDLSSKAWQDGVSDKDIAAVIKQGRGKMPAFNLPSAQIEALVKKVRSFNK